MPKPTRHTRATDPQRFGGVNYAVACSSFTPKLCGKPTAVTESSERTSASAQA